MVANKHRAGQNCLLAQKMVVIKGVPFQKTLELHLAHMPVACGQPWA